MVRFSRKFLYGFSLSFAMLAITARAGTILVTPGNAPDPEDADYPASAFGSGPAHGISNGFASRQVIDMDTIENDDGTTVRPSGRGIASVGSNPNSGEDPAASSRDLGNGSNIVLTQSSARTASEMSRKGVQEVAIIASDLGYFPKTIFVSRDVPVRMFVTGASKNTLCIMMDSFQVRKQIRSQKIEEITFTPNSPGKYRFYCPVNGMEGSLVVKELESPYKDGEPSAGLTSDSGGTVRTRMPSSAPGIVSSFGDQGGN